MYEDIKLHLHSFLTLAIGAGQLHDPAALLLRIATS
jgi:hypothetical protein